MRIQTFFFLFYTIIARYVPLSNLKAMFLYIVHCGTVHGQFVLVNVGISMVSYKMVAQKVLRAYEVQ